jgi:pimeloyl-ACP methyl ester carboxylesterase
MDAPEIRYALSGNVHIAYQVFGDGPLTLVVNPGSYSHLEMDWENPPRAKFYEGLGAFARVVLYDKRGTGLSDRGVGVPPLEVRIDDARAVMDAEGIDEAALMGYSEWGAMALLLAATHPQRVRSLVIHGVTPSVRAQPDVPGSERVQARQERALEAVRKRWGTGEGLADFVGDESATPEAVERFGRYLRAAASLRDAFALIEMDLATDVRAVLPTVAAPTLVIARRQDRLVPLESVRYIADHIPGATFWEQEGPVGCHYSIRAMFAGLLRLLKAKPNRIEYSCLTAVTEPTN